MKYYVTFRLDVDLDLFDQPLRTKELNRYITITARNETEARKQVLALRDGPKYQSILSQNEMVKMGWAFMSDKTELISDKLVDLGHDCWRVKDLETDQDVTISYWPKSQGLADQKAALAKMVVKTFKEVKNKTQVKITFDKSYDRYIIAIKPTKQMLSAHLIERAKRMEIK